MQPGDLVIIFILHYCNAARINWSLIETERQVIYLNTPQCVFILVINIHKLNCNQLCQEMIIFQCVHD